MPITVGPIETNPDYLHIHDAVKASPCGATILVYPGTYVEEDAVCLKDGQSLIGLYGEFLVELAVRPLPKAWFNNN